MRTLLVCLIAAIVLGMSARKAVCQNPQSDLPALQRRIEALEKRVSGIEQRLPQSTLPSPDQWDRPPGMKAVQPTVRVAQPATSFSGHTHTCANGHTWDHSMDGGSHRCPQCGLSQYVQDSPAMRGQVVYSLGNSSSAGGCANGACALPQRTGLARRWNR